jgi:hypothetical protein
MVRLISGARLMASDVNVKIQLIENSANKSPLNSIAKELTRRMERLDESPLCVPGKPKRRLVKAFHTLRDPTGVK